MNPAYFVTATGTDIGKTYVSAALLRYLTGKSWETSPVKPLMSGFCPEQMLISDIGQLLTACGLTISPENIAKTCAYHFSEAVAPNLAARKSNVEIDFDALVSFCCIALSQNKKAPQQSLCLVEGAGGILSPATDQKTQADLISALNLPVILVTANYLGSISHTLTALEVLDARGIEVATIAVSQPQQNSPDPLDFIDEMQRWYPADYVPVAYNEAEFTNHTGAGARLAKALNL